MKLAKRLMMRQQTSGGSWTPEQITGALWFDPDNAAFRTLDGSAITSLTDVIGGTITISQATAAAKPTLLADNLNGHDVASFDGGDYLAGTITPAGTSAISIFSVWLTTDSATDILAMLGAGSTNAGFGIGRNPSTGGYNCFVWGGVERYIAGTYSRYVMQLAQRNVSGVRAGLDGTLTTYGSTALNLASGTFYVGRSIPSSAQSVNGKLAAMVIGAFSDADVDKLFGWAAHKYSLDANLPSGHPYKSAAPTV